MQEQQAQEHLTQHQPRHSNISSKTITNARIPASALLTAPHTVSFPSLPSPSTTSTWQKFTRPVRGDNGSTISIRNDGTIGLSKGFCFEQNLRDFSFAILHYNMNPDDPHIAIQFTTTHEPCALNITRREGRGAELAATTFFQCFGLDPRSLAGWYTATRLSTDNLPVPSDNIAFDIDLSDCNQFGSPYPNTIGTYQARQVVSQATIRTPATAPTSTLAPTAPTATLMETTV